VANEPLFQDLMRFFRAARHLWGRCPSCNQLFRLSEAAISYGNTPPNDWLKRLQQREGRLEGREGELQTWHEDLEFRERELRSGTRDLDQRTRQLSKLVKAEAARMLKEDPKSRKLITAARREGAQKSRTALLGTLFERLAPFARNFAHDPNDLRPILNPIDFVCFDGLTASGAVERVTFVEVKSGTSTPTPRQRSIEAAVQDRRVGFELWQLGERGVPLEQQLVRSSRERKALPPGDEDD